MIFFQPRGHPGAQTSRKGPALPAVSTRVSLEDLKGENIQKAVLKDCLLSNWSIFPWATGVAVTMVGVVALSPAAVGGGALLFFVGSAAFIYNYVISGESRAVEKVNSLRALRHAQTISDLGFLSMRCREAGFKEGAAKADQLQLAYNHLQEYFLRKDGAAVEGWKSLAEDTFKQGLASLTNALDLYKAIKSVDLDQLAAEAAAYKKERGTLDKDSPRARTLKMAIKDRAERAAFVETNKDQLAELLLHAEEIEAALQEALLKLAAMGNQDPASFLDSDGGSAQRLKSAVDAAKRVEERLRGQSDAETAALRSEYIDAGR
jgi:hypothetical protein